MTADPHISYNIIHDVIEKTKKTHMTSKLVKYSLTLMWRCVWLCGGVVVWRCGCVAVWVIHLLISGHDRRTAPKFGTHVRIDTLTLKKIKIKLTHPTPGGFRGLYIVKKNSRRIAPKFGTHVRIDTLTLKKKIDPPHPRGV